MSSSGFFARRSRTWRLSPTVRALLIGRAPLRVGRRLEADPPALVQVGQDRADADVVEARRQRVRIAHEAFRVLEEDALVPLRDTGQALAAGEPRRVLARVDPLAARFHADQLD